MQFQLTIDSSLLHISPELQRRDNCALHLGQRAFNADFPFPRLFSCVALGARKFSLTLNNPFLKISDAEQERGSR